jgi:hypothetical protein
MGTFDLVQYDHEAYQACPACGKGRSCKRPEEGWLPVRVMPGGICPTGWECETCGTTLKGLHQQAWVIGGVRYGVDYIKVQDSSTVQACLEAKQVGAPWLIFDGSWDASGCGLRVAGPTAFQALRRWCRAILLEPSCQVAYELDNAKFGFLSPNRFADTIEEAVASRAGAWRALQVLTGLGEIHG